MHNPKLPLETLILFANGRRDLKEAPKTLYRWSEKGLLNRNTGVRYTLEWRSKGSGRGTNQEALFRFYDKVDRRKRKTK